MGMVQADDSQRPNPGSRRAISATHGIRVFTGLLAIVAVLGLSWVTLRMLPGPEAPHPPETRLPSSHVPGLAAIDDRHGESHESPRGSGQGPGDASLPTKAAKAIRGVVLRSSGEGAEGIALTLSTPDSAEPTAAGSTLAHGTFSVTLPERGPLAGNRRMRLTANDGDTMATSPEVSLLPPNGLLVLVLELGGIIRVRCLDADGRMPDRGEVLVTAHPGGVDGRPIAPHADDRISFVSTLSRLGPDGRADVRVRAGRVSVRARRDPESPWSSQRDTLLLPGRSREVDIRLPSEGVTASLRVLDMLGSPIANAWVQAAPRERVAPPDAMCPAGVDFVTDSEGLVRLPRMSVDSLPIRVAAATPRTIPGGTTLDGRTPDQVIRLALRPVIRMRVTGTASIEALPVDWRVIRARSPPGASLHDGRRTPETALGLLTGEATVEETEPGRVWSAYVLGGGTFHVRGSLPGGLTCDQTVVAESGSVAEVQWELPALQAVQLDLSACPGSEAGMVGEGLTLKLRWEDPAGKAAQTTLALRTGLHFWLPAHVNTLTWEIANEFMTAPGGTLALERDVIPSRLVLPEHLPRAVHVRAARVAIRLPRVGVGPGPRISGLLQGAGDPGIKLLTADSGGMAVAWLPLGRYRITFPERMTGPREVTIRVEDLGAQQIDIESMSGEREAAR